MVYLVDWELTARVGIPLKVNRVGLGLNNWVGNQPAGYLIVLELTDLVNKNLVDQGLSNLVGILLMEYPVVLGLRDLVAQGLKNLVGILQTVYLVAQGLIDLAGILLAKNRVD